MASQLKSRVKSLLTRQKEKSLEEEDNEPSPSTGGGGSSRLVESSPQHIEEQMDEVIRGMDQVYFEDDENLDTAQYELKKLGDGDIDMDSLMDRLLVLKREDGAIYRKIYDLVYANYTAYVQELENVTALEISLQEATRTCVNTRRHLRMAKEGVSSGGLGLLAKHRKRERCKEVIKQQAETRLKEFLEEGNYPNATSLCLNCQQLIETYKQYTCVNQLAVSLQDIQTLIENELEQALGKVPTSFDSSRYQLVQEAYRILGKTQRANDILLMKFTTAIHDSAYGIVSSFVQSSEATENKLQSYQNICKLIKPDDFTNCLVQLCKVFWSIMYNYNSVRKWHVNYDSTVLPTSLVAEDDLTPEDKTATIAEITFHRNYIKQKLDNGLVRMWRDVQQKLRPYLEGCDMSHFQYDNFIRVLDIVNRLIIVGKEFCGEGSERLQESMRQQSLSYFRYYHRARLDELKLFLESEQWVLCPIRANFTVDILREFRFLRMGMTTPTSPHQILSSWSTDSKRSVFERFTVDSNPFEETIEDEETEEIVMDTRGFDETVSDDEGKEEEDVSEELKKNYVDEKTGEAPPSKLPSRFNRQRTEGGRGPVLANVTLTVVRFCGNYMQMMNVLQPIAYDVLQCLTHLFDYYLYAVYTFFAQDMISDDSQLSAKLIASLSRISDTLLKQDTAMSPDDSLKVPYPVANPFLQIDNSASLYGLSFRVVAIESLFFLASQFEYLLPNLERLIPSDKRNFLTQFYSQTVTPCYQLRAPVYSAIASKSIPTEQIVHSMSSVKWDIKEITSQHSRYVDQLLNEFTRFKEMLDFIDKEVHIPSQSLEIIWHKAIETACHTFVDGFSQAKKCSNEGRALMQLDFQQFRTKMEKLTNLRPLPSHDYVESYIKAYYLSEGGLEEWLQAHNEYSSKALQALVLCGSGGLLNRKSKQKLLSLLEK